MILLINDIIHENISDIKTQTGIDNVAIANY